ncbi:hypothetical protein U2065_14925, partial [Listeria monocytogenes]|uniref:hypothetical protein n=1 Tax=Listeria monocytogenes TaxID=1639 RepID=UPI002FDBB304
DGEMLPPNRYGHYLFGPSLVAIHTHAIEKILPSMPPTVINIFRNALTAAISMTASPEDRDDLRDSRADAASF